MTNYLDRICIPLICGNNAELNFFTKNNLKVASNYCRVVIGERGPYIEFDCKDIILSSMYIPYNQLWRKNNKNCYYIEYRTIDKSYVKIYYQVKLVNYADYKVGFYYISPFQLKTDFIKDLVLPMEK